MRIGVTGNYASGKSTVCSFFKKLGAVEIDTDIISRDCVKKGSSVLADLIREFGEDFIDADGNLERRKLASHVFPSGELTLKLNSILHPAISKIVMEKSSGNSAIFMINAPLLFESKLNTLMDRNIVVVADEELQIERGIKRDGLTRKEISERLSRQISVNEKIKYSDYVIYNSGNLSETKQQVEDIWKILMTLFSRKEQ